MQAYIYTLLVKCEIFLPEMNCDGNLLKKWTFENFWTHFEVLLDKVSSEFKISPTEPQNHEMRGSPYCNWAPGLDLRISLWNRRHIKNSFICFWYTPWNNHNTNCLTVFEVDTIKNSAKINKVISLSRKETTNYKQDWKGFQSQRATKSINCLDKWLQTYWAARSREQPKKTIFFFLKLLSWNGHPVSLFWPQKVYLTKNSNWTIFSALC